jgi:hypothetical protein
MGNDDSPRPGFNHWMAMPGQSEATDPMSNVNGVEQSETTLPAAPPPTDAKQ